MRSTFSKLFLIAGMAWLSTALLPAAEAPAKFSVSEFSFTRPPKWEWIEVSSPMRKAQLRVPDEASKTGAEVVFFHFGQGAGGGTRDNVERWFRQFQEPRDKINAKTEETTIGKTKVTYVHAEGTYLSGLPGQQQTPMKNYALMGGIIEGKEGSVFIRMTGPTEVVKGAQADFKKMVESALK
ncbi:MAG: hypothetical protein AB1813_23480 [Verrucomicrobiota bacterium]